MILRFSEYPHFLFLYLSSLALLIYVHSLLVRFTKGFSILFILSKIKSLDSLISFVFCVISFIFENIKELHNFKPFLFPHKPFWIPPLALSDSWSLFIDCCYKYMLICKDIYILILKYNLLSMCLLVYIYFQGWLFCLGNQLMWYFLGNTSSLISEFLSCL